jgi:creatinine amidohydrolase
VSKSRIMYNMTVEEVRDGLREMKTIIIPVGVVEQHGYHLPLSVDIHNAVEIARMTSEETGSFVAPPIHYSFSGGNLPGTINISPQCFSMVLMEICHAVVIMGFKNIVILLGHGGTENVKAAFDAAENFQRLRPELESVTVSVVPFWEMSPTFMKGFAEKDFHAAKYETSLMLYWKPEMVRMDKAKRDKPHLVKMMADDQDGFLQRTKIVDSKYVVAKSVQHPEIEVGVMGNYDGASAELGKILAEEGAAGVAALVRELEEKNGNG